MSERLYARVGDLRVAYRDVGQGDPIVFLHGFPGAESWDGVADRLRQRFRCIVVDTLGLGYSEGPVDADHGLPGQARMVCGLLRELALPPVHLVGNDTGGAIAQLVAVGCADRVRRLVLCDCDAYDNWPPPQIKLLQHVVRLPGAMALMAAFMRVPAIARSRLGFGRLVFDKRLLTAERLARYTRPISAGGDSRERYRRFFLAQDCRHTLEIADRLRRFDHPTMIVWGCDDEYWTPSWGKKLYDEIAGAERLELIPFAGLSCHEERPDVFANLLVEFLGAEAGLGISARDGVEAQGGRGSA